MLEADERHFVVEGVGELLPDCLERALLNALEQDAQIFRARSQLALRVPSVCLHLFIPSGQSDSEWFSIGVEVLSLLVLGYDLEREEERGRGEQGGRVLEHPVLDEGQLDQVASEVELPQLQAGHLGEALEEAEGGGRADVEVQLGEQLVLLLEDLLLVVGLVRDVHEVPHFWRVNLLVLGGDQHRSHAHQLQLSAVDHLLLKVPVDEVDGEEERLWQQLELMVHLNEPVN